MVGKTWPSTEMIVSPGAKPACAAGEPRRTCLTRIRSKVMPLSVTRCARSTSIPRLPP